MPFFEFMTRPTTSLRLYFGIKMENKKVVASWNSKRPPRPTLLRLRWHTFHSNNEGINEGNTEGLHRSTEPLTAIYYHFDLLSLRSTLSIE